MSEAPVITLPALTNQEDSFALAVIEYGGNLGAAFKSVFGPDAANPAARARLLLMRPEVAKRINELTVAIEEHALISLGSHLQKLAEIRDQAMLSDQLKVALGAETKRGEVAGFYAGKTGTNAPKDPNEGPAAVHIHIGGSVGSPAEWAAKHGNAPVIIEMPTK